MFHEFSMLCCQVCLIGVMRVCIYEKDGYAYKHKHTHFLSLSLTVSLTYTRTPRHMKRLSRRFKILPHSNTPGTPLHTTAPCTHTHTHTNTNAHTHTQTSRHFRSSGGDWKTVRLLTHCQHTYVSMRLFCGKCGASLCKYRTLLWRYFGINFS